jgi:hypothetical protein
MDHENSFKLIESWLLECSRNHKECRVQNDEHWRPTRLLDVSSANQFKIILTENIPPESQVVYMTLSHCWGSHVPTRLLTTNVGDFMSGCNLAVLPKTFQDAVCTARRLNVQYLWIDCLCIIQDSEDDWRRESATMGSVYQQSFLNLAATAAPNATHGMFVDGRTDLCCPDLEVQHSKRRKPAVYFLSKDSHGYGFETYGPLIKRGWVMQELVFPPRVVHFDQTQIQWQCRVGRANETWARLHSTKFDTVSRSKGAKNLLRKTWFILNDVDDEDKISRWWESLVVHYSGLGLSHATDKLVAFSGLASAFLQKRKDFNDVYLAGLFRNDLPQALLWKHPVNYVNTAPRSLEYRAPSWSWASVDGKITYPRVPGPRDRLCQVLDAAVTLVDDSNLTGQVLAGFLRIRGPVLHCTWELLGKRGGLPSSRIKTDRFESEGVLRPDESESFLSDIYLLLCLHNIGHDVLLGLVVQPVGKYYRRVGHLSWDRPQDTSFQAHLEANTRDITLI